MSNPPPAFTPNRSPLAIDQRSLAVTLFSGVDATVRRFAPKAPSPRQEAPLKSASPVQVTVRDFFQPDHPWPSRVFIGEEVEAAVSITVL